MPLEILCQEARRMPGVVLRLGSCCLPVLGTLDYGCTAVLALLEVMLGAVVL